MKLPSFWEGGGTGTPLFGAGGGVGMLGPRCSLAPSCGQVVAASTPPQSCLRSRQEAQGLIRTENSLFITLWGRLLILVDSEEKESPRGN